MCSSDLGLAGSAVQSGLRLIVVVGGAKTAKDRADEARKLLEWGFRGFESRALFAEGSADGRTDAGARSRDQHGLAPQIIDTHHGMLAWQLLGSRRGAGGPRP